MHFPFVLFSLIHTFVGANVKKANFKWYLTTLLVVALSALVNWQKGGVTVSSELPKSPTESVVTPQDDRHHEATLTDASNLYRVCSTCPQRISPNHGSRPGHGYNPCGLERLQKVKPLYFLHDIRKPRKTAAFPLSASCKYYVIALRHIIR